jgi:PAS domain S-box-containing protein
MAIKPTYEELEQRIKELKSHLEEMKETLRMGVERYKLATSAAKVGVWDWNIGTGEFYLDPSIKAILGYTDDEIQNDIEVWLKYVHPEDSNAVMKAAQACLDGVTAEYIFEHRMLHKDGSNRWILARGQVIRDESGNAVRLIGTDADITERKQPKNALRHHEELLKLFVKHTPAAVAMCDQQMRYLSYSDRWAQDYGLGLDSLVGICHYDLFPDLPTHWKEEHQRCFEGKVIERDVEPFPRKNGSMDWVQRKLCPWRHRSGEIGGLIMFTEVVTDKKQLEDQLHQSQKMESIGTLAGGIAHDFNNLLMGIQGRASLISMDLKPSHPHVEHIKAIEDSIRGGTNLTKQLLGFARGGKYEVRPIDINELLLESATMFGRTKKEIHIHTKLLSPPPVVVADRRQIEQVLLNLYINAWQAMPDGGDLYLETRMVTLDDAYCKSYQVEPGRYAKVSVTDTGTGMDGSIRRQIFDPFFTTKNKGRGTGLGLASAYGIIKNHAGIITVDSRVGQGTKFNIYLPISEKKIYKEVPIGTELVKGSETILLVEDEALIMQVGQAMLEKLGYRVIAAKNGKQAVDTIEKNGDEIDLVILDLIMPEMGGGRAFDLIREIKPALPVILCSGYSLNGQANAIMRRGCNAFIQKPFTISELSQKVRKILGHAKRLVKSHKENHADDKRFERRD